MGNSIVLYCFVVWHVVYVACEHFNINFVEEMFVDTIRICFYLKIKYIEIRRDRLPNELVSVLLCKKENTPH